MNDLCVCHVVGFGLLSIAASFVNLVFLYVINLLHPLLTSASISSCLCVYCFNWYPCAVHPFYMTKPFQSVSLHVVHTVKWFGHIEKMDSTRIPLTPNN